MKNHDWLELTMLNQILYSIFIRVITNERAKDDPEIVPHYPYLGAPALWGRSNPYRHLKGKSDDRPQAESHPNALCDS